MIQLALIAARGTSTAMILSKAEKAGHAITSVISVSEKMFKAAGRDLLKLFRITTGKNAGQLTKRALDGMNHSAATASSAEKTLFAANVAAGRFTPAQANIFTRFKNGLLSPSEARTLFMRTGMKAAGVAAIFPLLEDEDEDAETEYNVLTGQEVPKVANRTTDPNDIEVRNLPESLGQRVSGALGIVSNRNIEGRNQIIPAIREPVPALPPREPQPRGTDIDRGAAQQRRDAERAAIRDASPRFTKDELSPYKKVAEPGFGQKLFGLRRSKSEIDRDVTYTDLKMQGRDEAADQYWADWNAENKAKRDAALGGAGSLTEYTRDDADRETSFAENIASAAEKFSTVVKEKLPQKKKGGGRVSSRPKSYRTVKVMKQYAKGGSVRKPNRIK